MQRQKLLSDSDSYPAFDVSNFPACIFALTPDSVTSATVLTDLVNGVTSTLSAANIVNNGDGTFQMGAGTITQAAIATWGDDDGMMVVTGTMGNSDAVGWGTIINQPAINYSTAGTQYVGFNISNYQTLPAQTASGISSGCGIVTFDNSGNTSNVNTYSGGTYETDAGAVSAGSLNQTYGNTIADNFSFPRDTPISGLYLLKWSTIPDANEIKRAAAWMADNQTAGLYPGWLYRT